MSALIDQIFTKSQADSIRQLWEDKSCNDLLQKEIGKQLLNNEDVIKGLPLTQIMFLTSLSNFSSSKTESNDVAEIIYWGIKEKDIFPSIVNHQNKELAYRCLISLSLFRKAIDAKHNRRGAPSADFYRQVGINTFRQIGQEDISLHFYQWENFISEVFV